VASALAKQLLNAWNAHDVDRLVALYAPDYLGIDVGRPMPERGPQGARERFEWYVGAFPDLRFTVEEPIAQGSQAAVVWTATGTHRARLMNIPPTGRAVSVRGVSVLTVEGGVLVRGLHVWDSAGLLRAIGLLPDL
jgi:steroid delta-isomerase-like uncharacterized protein